MNMGMHARSPASKHSFCHPEGSHTLFLPERVGFLRDADHTRIFPMMENIPVLVPSGTFTYGGIQENKLLCSLDRIEGKGISLIPFPIGEIGLVDCCLS